MPSLLIQDISLSAGQTSFDVSMERDFPLCESSTFIKSSPRSSCETTRNRIFSSHGVFSLTIGGK